MDLTTIASIILGAAGVLIVGMAVLIKGMILGKLTDIQKSITHLVNDMAEMDKRLTLKDANIESELKAIIYAMGLELKELQVEHNLKKDGSMGCHHTCKD